MIRFRCECGRQLQADDASVGTLAQCPLCQRTAPVPSADQPRPAWGAGGIITRAQTAPDPSGRPVPDEDVPARRWIRNPFALGAAPQVRHDGDAALALGIAALFIFGVTTPFAIFFGVRALWRIYASEEELPGAWKAVAGIVCTLLSPAVVVLYVVLIP
jgi:hypothetical protein